MRIPRAALALVCAGIVFTLSGCAHSVALMARNGGETGTGTATGFGGSGNVTVVVGGKKYVGKWVNADNGAEAVGFGSFGTPSTTSTAFAAGNGIGIALLHAADGSGMRCKFTWSPWSQAGYGVCEHDTGHLYDMQIN